jgi:hypothetical protein
MTLHFLPEVACCVKKCHSLLLLFIPNVVQTLLSLFGQESELKYWTCELGPFKDEEKNAFARFILFNEIVSFPLEFGPNQNCNVKIN